MGERGVMDPDNDMDCPVCPAKAGEECENHDATFTEGGPENCYQCGEPNQVGQHDRCCSIGIEQDIAMFERVAGIE